MDRSIVTAIVRALSKVIYTAFGMKAPVRRRRSIWDRLR
jgi:hypothetical protein